MDSWGSVVLVGAGPGDPGLLTLAGREALESAQVVLYDRLARQCLRYAAPDAELVNVGKAGGSHPIPQEEINRLLLDYAGQGKRVVRLKGGDPYLFGRGGEEVERLARAGVPFRVVPGVTSALAAPAYAGIPATHRDHASSVHIITAHGKGGQEPGIPYPELARLGGTLVFLMGVSALPVVCGRLVEAGMDPATPAAIVENATTAAQRRLVGDLSALPGQAVAANIAPPAVLVVGRVCALWETCDWTKHLPLWGKKILVCAVSGTGSRLARLLRQQGCFVEELACIRTRPLEQPPGFWRALGRYRWAVLTSPVAVELLFRRLRENRIDLRRLTGLRFAAVGRKTAGAIEAHGVLVELVPEVYDGRHLAQALLEAVEPGQRVLLFRAREGMEALPRLLGEGGVELDDVAAYETVYDPARDGGVPEQVRDGSLRYAAFTSASAVQGFVRSVGGADLGVVTALCIGESTAAAALAAGMNAVTSKEASVESLAALALKHFTDEERKREA